MWKGVIRFEDVELPVKLYAGIQEQTVRFRMLHDQDMVPVRQKMVNADTGDEVDRSLSRKGVEVEPGRFVLLSEEDMEALEPEASRTIEIERFVAPGRIGHQWYDRAYYLGPDGNEADYWAMVEALEKDNKEGVARWVMRKKQYVGSLRASNDALMLVTLRFADEVIEPSQLDAPSGRKLDEREQKMAEQLIGALADEFDPGDYQDTYRQRVMELVRAKAEGGEVELKELQEEPRKQASLAGMLEASLKATGEKTRA
jgi:DNA end-binding protein Ku